MHSMEKYYTWEANKKVEIRKSTDLDEIAHLTVPHIFKEAAHKYGNKPALVFMDNGQQKKVTFV